MFDSAPRLSHGAVTVRGIKLRDARTLETELQVNRPWLERWEATLPGTRPSGRFDTRSSIRSLLDADRDGSGLALVRAELPEPLLERWLGGRVPLFDRSVYPIAVGDDPRGATSA